MVDEQESVVVNKTLEFNDFVFTEEENSSHFIATANSQYIMYSIIFNLLIYILYLINLFRSEDDGNTVEIYHLKIYFKMTS